MIDEPLLLRLWLVWVVRCRNR